jgi:peptide/nickel transport system permease protein
VTLFIISLIVFLGVEALPGDTATAYLGQAATAESLDALREEFGLNAPMYERYLKWLGGFLKGDMGDSMVRRMPVSELIGNRFRNTIVLAAAAAIVGIPLAIFLGVIAGLTRDKWPDIFVSTSSIIGMTLPGFVTATVLIFIFAIRLEWFPAITLVPSDASIGQLLPNIVLPIITLRPA